MEQNYVTVNLLVIVACSGCVAAVKGQGLAVFKYSERVSTSNFPSATVFSRRESTYIADANATRRGAERCELGKTDNNISNTFTIKFTEQQILSIDCSNNRQNT